VPVHSGISRRGLLRGFAAAAGVAGVSLATGCDLFDGTTDNPGTDLAQPLDGFLKDTVALGDAYDAAIARVPVLTAVLTGPRDAHRAHARALAQAISAPSPKPGRSPTIVGADQAAVLTALAEAETKGRDAAREACLSTSSRLAPLLGSIAAARACHLEVLK
jgi:hypothetical protein